MEDIELILTDLDFRRGKEKVRKAVHFCSENNCFESLAEMLPKSSARRRGTLSWVIARGVSERQWEPSPKTLENFVLFLAQEKQDIMSKRCMLDVFQYAALPEEQLSLLFDTAIILVRSPQETAAVRAFGISVLTRIVKLHPELFSEVKDLLYALIAHEKASIRIRAVRALKELEGISSEP